MCLADQLYIKLGLNWAGKLKNKLYNIMRIYNMPTIFFFAQVQNQRIIDIFCIFSLFYNMPLACKVIVYKVILYKSGGD